MYKMFSTLMLQTISKSPCLKFPELKIKCVVYLFLYCQDLMPTTYQEKKQSDKSLIFSSCFSLSSVIQYFRNKVELCISMSSAPCTNIPKLTNMESRFKKNYMANMFVHSKKINKTQANTQPFDRSLSDQPGK